MIEELNLAGFKRFLNQSFQLGALNVLTGLNASGKSTVLQALNLLACTEKSPGPFVPLREEHGLGLGGANEICHYDSEDHMIRIDFMSGGESFRYTFDCSDPASGDLPYLKVIERPGLQPQLFAEPAARFQYVAAERMGPRLIHPSLSTPQEQIVGFDGRYVASLLATQGRNEVSPGRRNYLAGDVSTLLAQTEAWLSEMVGATQLDSMVVPRTSAATLRIRRAGQYGEWMLPTNTGFGLSYCLPIIVAGLLSSSGSVLCIDSPEAHLHPRAQSTMGFFLSRIAADGVQVIVETHSDHVVNGMRRSIAEGQGPDPASTFVWYFSGESPQRIGVRANGSLESWPSGFFDQISTDLFAITKASRP